MDVVVKWFVPCEPRDLVRTLEYVLDVVVPILCVHWSLEDRQYYVDLVKEFACAGDDGFLYFPEVSRSEEPEVKDLYLLVLQSEDILL